MTVLRVDTIAGTGTTFGPTLDGNLEFNSQNYIVLPKGTSNQQGVLRTTEDVIGVGGTYYDNLVLAMPFNEATGLRDVSSRNRNPGTYGNVAISTAQSKYYGSSAYFDGSGDFIELTDTNNDFDLGGTNATLECWVYPTATSASVIIAKGGNTANWVLTDGFIYQLQYDPSTSKIVFYYNNGGGAAGVTGISGGTQSINSWYHVAVVTNTSNNITLYINGTSVATATNAISKPTTRTRFRLGTDLSNNDYQGYIQDFRIYKGLAKYTANFTPPERIAEIGVGFKTGQLRYNTDSNKVELYDGNQWTEVQSSRPDLNGGARGVFAGGYSTNTIDYINISSTGNAQDFGDLTVPRYEIASCSSSIRGLFAGGYPNTNAIDYITIASTGNAIDFGDRTVTVAYSSAVSNSSRGVFACGAAIPATLITNVIDYVTIASTGNAIDFGDALSSGFLDATSLSSTTRGIFAGGAVPSVSNTIQYITIATLGNSQEFGDLTSEKRSNSGCSNSTRGIIAGGYTSSPTTVNTIEFITIATLGNAQNFGDLTRQHRNPGGCASTTRGVFGGGDPNVSPYPASNIIDYVNILTQANAVDFGDLSIARIHNSACSNAHGGL